ncbi:terminase small subunit [uncultured Sneathia sp.]|uniref:terminase small subunit n=1 Tax=uncultured Sneathia sp. TaxID=278067 RepID=UPI002592CBAB|nr:terminase small subunit [uncultured Sneathia sp.]
MLKLTKKQKLFCEYYKSTHNATDSAIKSGYSKKTAYAIGSKLLKEVKIQEYLNDITKNSDTTRIMNMEQIQEFWASVVNDKKAKLTDRLKASEYIAKSSGAFITKTEISGELKTESENKVSLLSTEDLKTLVDGIKDSE